MSLVDDPEFVRLRISGRLPAPKGIALQVIQLTQQADASNHAIAKLIGSDPALSVRVIKAANVLFGNASRPVVTIADAVMVLGARGLRQLVLGIALIVDYNRGPCRQFDYLNFWTASLLTGIAARHLAKQAKLAASEEIFVVGLLSNIGRLALATVFPDEFSLLLSQSEVKSATLLYASEREQFGFDENELSEAILADMKFPKIFQRMAGYCNQPDGCKVEEASREWRLLHLLHSATLLADIFLAKPAARGKLVSQLKWQSARIAVDLQELVKIGDACAEDWLAWSSLLHLGNRPGLPPFAELLQSAEADEKNAARVDALIDPGAYPLRVLLVEDDLSTLALLDAMLQAAGHSVSLARNGVEAQRLAEERLPQLVITDWMMPEMDGITLCRRLRQSAATSNLHVIILTALENPDRLVEAFEAGADDYLVKPVTPKMFFARLRAAQRVIRLQDELAFDREQLQRFSQDLTMANDRLQQLALTDELTGLPNRRAAMERLEQEWSMTLRGNRPLACMMVDIDHFKSVNDTLGHPVGDRALKQIASTLRQAARTQDVVCRFGGEEFLVICPDTTAEAAYQCAERMRQHVAETVVGGVSPPLKLTISIGVDAVTAGSVTLDELLSCVDKRLYAAKLAGRNRTIY